MAEKDRAPARRILTIFSLPLAAACGQTNRKAGSASSTLRRLRSTGASPSAEGCRCGRKGEPDETTPGAEQNLLREARKGPNFAGHYTIVIWSCGWPCINLAIVDIDSGKIYNTPFVGVLGFGGCDGNMGNDGPLAYRIDSSLLVVTGSLEIGDLKTHFIHGTPCKGYYYRWYGQQLKLILETFVPFGSPPPK